MALDPVADVLAILGDQDTLGQAVTVTAPDGTSEELTGFASEIGQTVEPETGQVVSGTRASVSLPLGPFRTAFGASALPVHVASGTGAPWLVEFTDAGGDARTYKVIDTMPDKRAGVLTCLLENYRP